MNLNRHNPELVSALVDGQLTGLRRWLTQRHVDACPTCAEQYRQEQQLHATLAANPPPIAMSDSADFFWSKVRRDIDARGTESIRVPVPTLSLRDWLGQHHYALASATTALVAVFGLFWTATIDRTPPPQIVMVENASTELPDTDVTICKGSDKSVSVIWVSGLPWTPNLSEMKSVYNQQET
jgi:anti-sigma factor RsiW